MSTTCRQLWVHIAPICYTKAAGSNRSSGAANYHELKTRAWTSVEITGAATEGGSVETSSRTEHRSLCIVYQRNAAHGHVPRAPIKTPFPPCTCSSRSRSPRRCLVRVSARVCETRLYDRAPQSVPLAWTLWTGLFPSLSLSLSLSLSPHQACTYIHHTYVRTCTCTRVRGLCVYGLHAAPWNDKRPIHSSAQINGEHHCCRTIRPRFSSFPAPLLVARSFIGSLSRRPPFVFIMAEARTERAISERTDRGNRLSSPAS